jgi:simple sugar transport system permease protein
LTQRFLARPAAGALIIVIFVWIVFVVLSLARGNTAFLSLAGTLNYLDVAAQIGVIATSVALLMIAGEFDLVDRVDGRVRRDRHGDPRHDRESAAWLSIILGDGDHDLPRRDQRLHRRPDRSAVVHRDAGHLFIIRGASSVLTSSVSPITYIPLDPTVVRTDPLGALFGFSLPITNPDGSTTSVQVSILVWLVIAIVGIYILGRTRFGNWIAGVGGSGAAARNLGVPVSAREDHVVRD